mmetsp:Transcript_9808/g.26683  ORF Transcript_9808/g.26683 Transcript_9808/m.26683 type:complete len:321 (-) Transcript_9808:629-1591(-)
MAMAVTISGDVTNACVAGLASLRAAKFLLNDVTIELASPLDTSVRFHWPMHGPHAFARTVPPTFSKISVSPSLVMVALICSLPGLMANGTLALIPAARACLATLAALVMSSYEELVQEPISPAETLLGQPFFLTASANSEIPCAKSGVKGPLTCGSSSLRLISIISSYSAPSSARRFSAKASASEAILSLPVALRYSPILELYGNIDVVAPISAPMLQMVPIPVALMLSTPGPKYSTIAPVPPLTVRMPATLQMTSFGDDHPLSFPVSLTPITFGALSSHGSPAITSTASAPPTPTAHIPMPPALGVCESVPIIMPPGKA